MPFALFIIGTTLVIAGARDTALDLAQLVKGDFQGQNSYVNWVVAILVLGALGYVESMKEFSRAFLALIIVALFLKNGQGFFARLQQNLNTGV